MSPNVRLDFRFMNNNGSIGCWAYPRRHARGLSTCVALFPFVACGCTQLTNETSGDRARLTASLLLPDEISVIGPFTGFVNFDDQPGVDGIELCIQPLNAFDEPIRLVGTLRVELLSYVGTSGDPRGEQIAQWEIPLSSKADQNTHWNRATRMYELHLDLDRTSLKSESKYVLQLTTTDAFGSMVSSHHVIELGRL
ncbi:MAG: hypothetical protein IIB57_10225 [Planctomycetes bacterium]|nr:hypothetical protein [Planctomycetota bacterium]